MKSFSETIQEREDERERRRKRLFECISLDEYHEYRYGHTERPLPSIANRGYENMKGRG